MPLERFFLAEKEARRNILKEQFSELYRLNIADEQSQYKRIGVFVFERRNFPMFQAFFDVWMKSLSKLLKEIEANIDRDLQNIKRADQTHKVISSETRERLSIMYEAKRELYKLVPPLGGLRSAIASPVSNLSHHEDNKMRYVFWSQVAFDPTKPDEEITQLNNELKCREVQHYYRAWSPC
jgi:uncharacterized protein YbgA (DUF1722 family)